MEGVTEHGEGLEVTLEGYFGREVIVASNQGGHDCTLVDLHQLITWLKANRPELLTN